MTAGVDLEHYDVTKLLEQPGKRRELHGTHEPLGLQTSSAEATALRYALTAEAIGSQIVVTGSAVGTWRGPCRRCLESVHGESEVALREIFEVDPAEGETYPMVEGHIDLAKMLEEAVLLTMPLAPLCEADCSGPAPDRFPTGSTLPEDPREAGPDPRWAALDELSFE